MFVVNCFLQINFNPTTTTTTKVTWFQYFKKETSIITPHWLELILRE